jgi:PAS domain S-box-containing protein
VGAQLGRVVERERSRRALQRSEARFRTIFEQSATGIQLTDVEGFFVDTNPALQDMLGYTSEELRHLGLTEVTHPDDMERTWDLLKSLLRGERDRYDTETRYLRKDGSVIWAQLSVSSVLDESGHSQYVVSLVHDITARKSMEAELEEVQRLLIASVETERARLARELHDGPLQDLYGAIYKMQDVIPALKNSPEEISAESTVVIIQQVISLLRSIVGELRPPVLGPFGLEKAIRAHTDRMRAIYPTLEIHLDLMSDGLSLSEKARMALEWVKLEVEDDGQGFSLPVRWLELAREGRVGLLGIQERAESFGGILEISPGESCGSRVTFLVPRERVEKA